MIYALKINVDPTVLFYGDDYEPDCELNAMVLVDSPTFFNRWEYVPDYSFHQEFDDWFAETMPGRTRMVSRGVHDFQFGDETLPDDYELLDHCRQVTYAFEKASDLALFKLTWGGA